MLQLVKMTRSMHGMLEKMVCKGGSWRSSKCEEGCKVGFNEGELLSWRKVVHNLSELGCIS